jgi:hypothetical protein
MDARLHDRQALAVRRMVATTAALVALIIPATASQADASYDWKCPKYTSLIKRSFPRESWRAMDAVMWRESRCIAGSTGFNYNPGRSHADCVRAHWSVYVRTCKHLRPNGRGVDWGLWQINGSWRSVTIRICGKAPETGVLLKPRCNFAVARWLYDNGGMAHWRGQSGSGR